VNWPGAVVISSHICKVTNYCYLSCILVVTKLVKLNALIVEPGA
jgi:hypothetical protein